MEMRFVVFISLSPSYLEALRQNECGFRPLCAFACLRPPQKTSLVLCYALNLERGLERSYPASYPIQDSARMDDVWSQHHLGLRLTPFWPPGEVQPNS